MRVSEAGAAFQVIAATGLEMAGIAVDPKSLTVVDESYRYTVVGLDETGLLDARVEAWNEQDIQDFGRINTLHSYADRYLSLQQQLRRDRGYYVVERGPRGLRDVVVNIDITTSPAGVNKLQQKLGREPGVNAFEIVRAQQSERFSSGEWIDGFAELQVPVANNRTADDFYANHDMDPNDHIQSWIFTPPYYVRLVGKRAIALQNRYNMLIHADDDHRPTEVDEFVEALDSLTSFTAPIARAVGKVHEQEGVSPLPWSKKIRLIDKHLNLGNNERDRKRSTELSICTLRSLGFIAANGTRSEAAMMVQTIQRDFVRHAIQMFERVTNTS